MRPAAVVPATVLTLLAVACHPNDAGSSAPPAPTTAPATAVPARPIAAATDCQDLVVRTVDSLQNYVDSFAGLRPDQIDTAAAEHQGMLDQTAAALRGRADELGCPGDVLDAELAEELPRLRGDGAVAESVAATLRSARLAGDDPSDPGARTMTVASPAELFDAVASAGSGSTIQLPPGTYPVTRTLVVFRPITITGLPGDGPVTIESAAPGAAVLSLADGELRLSDLEIRHVGDEPASVTVVGAGGYRFERVEIAGGRSEADGTGGIGLLLAPGSRAAGGQAVGGRVVDSAFRDNQGGGVVVSRGHAPELRNLLVEGPGGCGVCYFDRAAGSLRDSVIRDHTVGVWLTGQSQPVLTDLEFEDIVEAAIVLTGQSAGTVQQIQCDGSASGVVVVQEEARPTLGDGIACGIVDGQG